MRAVLTYHSVDDSGSPISIRPEAFSRHVRWLTSGRIKVTTVDGLVGLPDETDAVAITFDDGFANFGSQAAPQLLAAGLPVTVFVVSDRVGLTNDWCGQSAKGIPTLPLLNWQELATLAASGVTLGSHSRTHRDLTSLDQTDVDREIGESVDRIRMETGATPIGFAYPYGRVNHTVAARVAARCAWGCTTELRTLGTSEQLSLLPRLDMYYFQKPGRLEAWGTPRFARYLRFRRQLRAVRRLMIR